jgi:hypothetical protein
MSRLGLGARVLTVGIVSAAIIAATILASPLVQAGTSVQHQLWSGAMRVAGSGERADLHVVNGLDKSQEFDLRIVDKAGKVVASKTATVDAGKTLTLSYDPPAGVLVHARITFSTDVSISSDVAVPSLVIVKVGTGP